ncbi:Gti1/Pac2 family-domain-containing protein [Fomitopsis betulina]|nr:Gti1/Pac2 family-domain-containing protein [Fomitopsis betulina]
MAQLKQTPTLEGVHIRSADDAHKVFYAVMQNRLHPITKRLDAEERAALKAGDVYVWARQSLTGDAYSPHMERFTEGKSWTASRVRDDFLIYYEIPEKAKGRAGATQRAESSENRVVRQGEHDQFIKQTYSVYCNDPADAQPSPDGIPQEPKKWHLNAYFTKLTEGQLKTIDDIEELRNLVVPEGMFRSARTSKAGKKGESSRTTSNTKRQYAPFPSRTQPPQPSSSSQASTSALPPPPARAPVPPVSHESPQSGPSTSGAYQYPTDLQHYQQPQPQQYPQAQVYPHAAQYSQAAQYQQPSVGWPSAVHAPSDRAPQYSIPAELQPPYTPAPIPPGMAFLSSAFAAHHVHAHTEPNYVYSAAPPSPALSRHSNQSISPSLSDRSSPSAHSWGSPAQLSSVIGGGSPAPSLNFSRQSSPLFGLDGFPLTDDGLPYTPAPTLEDILSQRVALGPARVDLAPLGSLRSHPYRRCPADDRALRLLGPGAR